MNHVRYLRCMNLPSASLGKSSDIATLTAELAAARELIAAIRQLANPPLPADSNRDRLLYESVLRRRLDLIAIYAASDANGSPANMMTWRAEQLRDEAARPLPYTPETAAQGVAS